MLTTQLAINILTYPHITRTMHNIIINAWHMHEGYSTQIDCKFVTSLRFA